MAKSNMQNRVDLLGSSENKTTRKTLPSLGIPGVQANQQPIPGADQKPSNMLSDPRNSLTLKTPDTSQFLYGDMKTPNINPGATIDPAGVAHSGLKGTTPMGIGKNTAPYGVQPHPSAEQLEMVAGNRPGEQNKATNPYIGLTGLPVPMNGNMAMMQGTNQPANLLGFTGQAEPSGKTPQKLNAPKKKGGIA